MEERARLALLARMQEDLRAYVAIVLVRTRVRRLNLRVASDRAARLLGHAEALGDDELLAAARQLSLIPITRAEFDSADARGAARVHQARARIEARLRRLRAASTRGASRSAPAAT